MKTIALTVAALWAATGLATTWYVSPSGDGSNPSAGFSTGYKTIKAALASSLEDGDVVMLDKCTFDLSYTNRSNEVSSEISITKRITIQGAGTKDETVLEGGEEYDGRRWGGSGKSRHYPGFLVKANNVTFKNMTMKRMGSEDGYSAIYVDNNYTGCLVSNVVFRDTGWGYTAWRNFRGVVVTGNKDAVLSGCHFLDNKTPSCVLYATGGSNARVENCYFAGNTCTGEKTSTGNQYNYGVIYVAFGSSGDGWFRNNTIVNNKSAIGALYQNGGGSRIVNNIVYGNTDLDGVGPKDVNENSGSASMWTYNCLGEGKGTYVYEGNVFVDPQLASDGIHLSSVLSPCYQAGSATYATTTDYEGVTRNAQKPCIGCSEYPEPPFACEIKATADKVTLPDTVTLSVEITGTPSGSLTYAWDIGGDTSVKTATAVLDKMGKYRVSLVVTDAAGTMAIASYEKPIVLFPEGKPNLTWYVSPTGSGKNPLAGFATGYPTIKAALANEDLAAGDTILLDRAKFDCSYENRANEISSVVTITNRLVIAGVGTKEETVLDGGHETKKDGSVWDRRWADHNPRFYIKSDGVEFRNMTMERMASNGNATIDIEQHYTDCVISNVVIRNTGAGYSSWENMTGFLSVRNDKTIVSGCVFTNNVAPCPVVYMTGGTQARMENCYVASNTCTGAKLNWGVVYVAYGTAGGGWFRNNTIIENKSQLGALYYSAGGGCRVVNNIIYGNTDLNGVETKDIYQNNGQSDNAKLWTHNCFGQGSSVYTGVGNIFTDPALAADKIHLQSCSPCVGTASATYAPAVDIDGVSRLSAPCMGCTEYVGSGVFTCTITPSASPYVSLPENITLTAQIAGTTVEPLAYAWDFNGDGVIDSTLPQPALSEAGKYNVAVTVTDGAGNDARADLSTTLYVYPQDTAGADEKVFCVLGWENPNARAPFTNWVSAANSIKGAYTNAVKFANAKIVLGDGVYPVTETMSVSNGMVITSLNGRDRTMLTRPNLHESKGTFVLEDPSSVIERVTLCGAGSAKSLYAHGAAVNLTAGTLRDCIISNFCNKNYGVVKAVSWLANRPVRIERCAISGNTDCGSTQIAAYLAGYVTVENCLVADNVGSYSGSTAFTSGHNMVALRNCTFARNHTVNAIPITVVKGANVFENNIVTGCTTNNRAFPANDPGDSSGVVTKMHHCCVYPTERDYSDRNGVTTDDPKFVAADDCHLAIASPCRNKGTNYVDKSELAESKDFDGNRRLFGRRVDMGCCECQNGPGLHLIVR